MLQFEHCRLHDFTPLPSMQYIASNAYICRQIDPAHHFLQKHFTHLVLLILHRSFFFLSNLSCSVCAIQPRFKVWHFSLLLIWHRQSNCGRFKETCACQVFFNLLPHFWPQMPQQWAHKFREGKKEKDSQVQWGCHEKREKLRSTFFCLPEEVTSVGQSVGFGRDHFYLSRQHCTTDHQRLTSSRQKLSPLKRKSKDNFLWQISYWYLSIHGQIEI